MASGLVYLSINGDGTTVAQDHADSVLAKDADVTEQGKLLEVLAGALSGGFKQAHVRGVADSGATSVQASGTFTLTYANISNSDTCSLGSVVLTAVTGTPADETEFKKETDLATTVTNFVNCLNAHSQLKGLISASGNTSTGVVTLTSTLPGRIGNLVGIIGSTGIVASGVGLESGVSSSLQAARSYAFGQAG